ncbi:MAG: hypothetical protein DMF61_20995 [Blastocatellia bacterium AA13]|nr:MAG: hypothetical protein DMF61_20995 [Blastocatellia bacterium AA13]
MPDKKRKAKQEKWLNKKWPELFDKSIREVPDNTERIMVLMISLRRMIEEGKSGPKIARRPMQNCVKACIPFTHTCVAERAQWKFTKHAKKR